MFRTMCVRITTSVLLLSSSAVFMACSSSERQASPTADRAAETSQPTGNSPGMKAYIDPKTGEMGNPSDAQLAEMERQNAAAKTAQPVERTQTVVKMRNGGTAIFLDGNTETPMQGCVDAKGNLTVDHHCQSDQTKQEPKGDKP